MKKDDFVKLLDSIIERKIKAIVPKMIKEELKNIKPIIAEKKKSSNLDVSSLLNDEVIEETTQQVESIEKRYMKNDVLNKMLNETAGDMKKTSKKGNSYYDTDAMKDYKSVLAEEYSGMDQSDMAFASPDIVPTQRRNTINEKQIKTEMLKQEVVQRTGGNEKIANAMIKDYRGLMKAVDKKSKGTR